MRKSLFPRLALINLKANKQFYVPNILMNTGLLACFYIILALALDEKIAETHGGIYLQSSMMFGTIITALLSVVLVLYMNSFIMKQRKREYGIYNVLGMEKKHIGKVLFYESLYSTGVSMISGLFLGILFYKLCTLIVCRLMHVETILGMYFISVKNIVPSLLFFILLSLLSFLINLRTVKRLKPLEMIRDAQAGEKEPKVLWPLLILGVPALLAGYFLALTTKNALHALAVFFPASFLVILGTYFLFAAGTIFILRLLRKNKRYYYKPRHMTAVSGLLYRMKQNAAGLASISILATTVLVIVSTTVSMYAGIDASVKAQYPHQMFVKASLGDASIDYETFQEITMKISDDLDLGIDYANELEFFRCAFVVKDGELITDRSTSASPSECWFITDTEYRKQSKTEVSLKENEYLLYNPDTNAEKHPESTLSLQGKTYVKAGEITNYPLSTAEYSLVENLAFVVSEETFQEIFSAQQRAYGEYASSIENRFEIDFSDERKAEENRFTFADHFSNALNELGAVTDLSASLDISSKWRTYEYLSALNGSFLFLGIILSIVFMFATVLIIYYKQISEGYDDRHRFQIMKKVGITDQEVRGTIKTQILLVFFLPLTVALIHLLFASPLLSKLVKILFVINNQLFYICAGITFLLFALLYVLIYTVTAKVYYKIVR